MHPHNKKSFRKFLLPPGLVVAVFLGLGAYDLPAPVPSAASARQRPGGYTISVNVNLVVLYASVLDKRGTRILDLQKENFRVFENNVEQQTAIFSRTDIPVTMGIVIDDSASMRSRRKAVAAAALVFVQTSNSQDQVFVVNFNDQAYIDTPGDFASNEEDLKLALDKIVSRGGTALYDAVQLSLDHLKLGKHDKKVLLVISDGEDNGSQTSFEEIFRYAQDSDAVIYTIGILGEDDGSGLFKMKGGSDRRAAKILQQFSQATGGGSYFPKNLAEVRRICIQVAEDIRNQYTLGYYPTNRKKDGTFRQIRVEASNPRKKGRLVIRTRSGYYAPKPTG